MNKFYIMLLAASMVFTPCLARKKKSKTAQQPASAQVKSETKNGLFTVTKTGNDWFFSIPDSLIGREILVTVRYTSTPAGTGKYGGELANQQTVYFQKIDNEKMLLRSRLLLNAADSTDQINRAITISNEDPVIAAFKIESSAGQQYKIKVSPFLLEDNPAVGISRDEKKTFGLQSINAAASYIESIKTFPLNTEVRVVKTWNASSTNNAAAS